MGLSAIQVMFEPGAKLVATALTTGCGAYAGLTATKAFQAFCGVNLATFSTLYGYGMQSNQRKEVVTGDRVEKSQEQDLGDRVIARGTKHIRNDLEDFLKSSVITAGCVAATCLLYHQLGGQYIPEYITSSLPFSSVKASAPVYVVPASLLCTVSDTLFSMGVLKSITSLSSCVLAGIGVLQGQGIKSNEEKEGVDAREQIGVKASGRAWRIIQVDAQDAVKGLALFIIGTAGLCVGSFLGGTSIQSSALAVSKGFKFR